MTIPCLKFWAPGCLIVGKLANLFFRDNEENCQSKGIIVKGHSKLSILKDNEDYIYNPFYLKLSILVQELLHLTFFVLKLYIKSKSVIT